MIADNTNLTQVQDKANKKRLNSQSHLICLYLIKLCTDLNPREIFERAAKRRFQKSLWTT